MTSDGDSGPLVSQTRMEDARQQNAQLFGVFRDDHAAERARLDARDGLVTLRRIDAASTVRRSASE